MRNAAPESRPWWISVAKPCAGKPSWLEAGPGSGPHCVHEVGEPAHGLRRPDQVACPPDCLPLPGRGPYSSMFMTMLSGPRARNCSDGMS